MNEKITGTAGSYMASKTGRSVRMVVKLPRKYFDQFESALKRTSLKGDKQSRNTFAGRAIIYAVERWDGTAKKSPPATAICTPSKAGYEAQTAHTLMGINATLTKAFMENIDTIKSQADTIKMQRQEIESLRVNAKAPRAPIDYGPFCKRPELKVV